MDALFTCNQNLDAAVDSQVSVQSAAAFHRLKLFKSLIAGFFYEPRGLAPSQYYIHLVPTGKLLNSIIYLIGAEWKHGGLW